MCLDGFKLNKRNYKEVEYILNEFIYEKKKNHKIYVEKGVFSIEVHFECGNTWSIFTFVDEIRIVEWNDGIRVFIKAKETEHSVYYTNDTDIYSRVWFSGGGGKGDGSYVYNIISFNKPLNNIY